MKIGVWQALIKRAYTNESTLLRLSMLLDEQHRAAEILRAKGYGIQGQSVLEMAEMMPFFVSGDYELDDGGNASTTMST